MGFAHYTWLSLRHSRSHSADLHVTMPFLKGLCDRALHRAHSTATSVAANLLGVRYISRVRGGKSLSLSLSARCFFIVIRQGMRLRCVVPGNAVAGWGAFAVQGSEVATPQRALTHYSRHVVFCLVDHTVCYSF